MCIIGSKAYDFNATAIINGKDIVQNFSLGEYLGKKEIILFFYPGDFTFVCPTEILEFQKRISEFEYRNVAVIGCSTDSEYSHLTWLNTPQSEAGINGVKFPLIADSSKVISKNYGVLGGHWVEKENGNLEFEGTPIAYRGLFLIDKNGIIRYQSVSDAPLGRSIKEILRVIDMWQHFCTHGAVCPVNWIKGDKDIKPSIEGIKDYMKDFD